MTRPFSVLAVLLASLTPATTAAAANVCTGKPYTITKSTGLATIEVDWEALKKCADAKTPPKDRLEERIDEDTVVVTKVVHFNFVNYTLAYKVDETVVETYVNLAKLWTQALGLPAGLAQARVANADECASFGSCLGEWAFDIVLAEMDLNKFLAAQEHKIVLSGDSTTGDVKVVLDNYAAMQKWHEKLAADADNIIKTRKPGTVEEVDKFRRVYASHLEMLDRIGAFGAAADLVANGETHAIGKKKGGTIVAITMTPKSKTQATGSPVASVEYFSHSRLPVEFHVGYAFSTLKDVSFETVRSAAQADLYSVVKNNTNTNAMVAFLSLGKTAKNGQIGAFATIGTDFNKPGERVYVGGSINFLKRAFVTVGLVSGTEQVPLHAVTETVGNALNARELFAAINPERHWRGFGAISFRVF